MLSHNFVTLRLTFIIAPWPSTKLYCLVTEAHMCEQHLPRVVTWQCNGREWNEQTRDHYSNTLTA